MPSGVGSSQIYTSKKNWKKVQLFGISEQFGKRISVRLFTTLHIIIWMQSYPLAFVSIANEVFNFINGRIRYKRISFEKIFHKQCI